MTGIRQRSTASTYTIGSRGRSYTNDSWSDQKRCGEVYIRMKSTLIINLTHWGPASNHEGTVSVLGEKNGVLNLEHAIKARIGVPATISL